MIDQFLNSFAGSQTNMSTWSDLPEELLDLILQNLDLDHYGLFAKVCQSWCRTVRQRLTRRPLLVKPLYLKNSSEFRFFARWESGFRRLPLILKCRHPTRLHVGSSMGSWLILAPATTSPNRLNFRIVNVISAEEIRLPSHTRLRHSLTTNDKVCWVAAAMSSSPTSNDCIVVAAGFIINGRGESIPILARCKPADQDQGWSVLFNKWLDPVSMTFHKGALYILNENAHTHIYAFGVGPMLIRTVFYPSLKFIKWPCDYLLVASDHGELYLVEKPEQEYNWQKVGVDVYKLRDNEWTLIKNLGERVILLTGTGIGLCCTKDVARGFKGNCIYYYEPIAQDLSVYSLEDQSVTTILLPKQGWNISLRADWIIPQEW